jgi:hypothetical protein
MATNHSLAELYAIEQLTKPGRPTHAKSKYKPLIFEQKPKTRASAEELAREKAASEQQALNCDYDYDYD